MQKPLAEVVDGGGVVKAAVAAGHKKHYDPPKPETVIVVSSNEELEFEEKKPVTVIARKLRVGSSRNEVKTMTSILTTQSKTLCGPTTKPKDPIATLMQ
ncbi:hypothetical protein CsSME_00011507 [Camellia sinensis var. sinensis]